MGERKKKRLMRNGGISDGGGTVWVLAALGRTGKVSHAHRGRDPRLAHRTREGRFLVVHLKAFHNEPSPPDPDKWYLVLGMGETTGLWNV